MGRKREWMIAALMFLAVAAAVMTWGLNAGHAFAEEVGTVTATSGLNMRSGIGTSYEPPITKIPAGTQITVLDVNAGKDTYGVAWYKINYNGQEGYVSSQYVILGTQPASPTPAATPVSEATPAPAPSLAPVTPQTVTIYRTTTTYKKINVPARMKKTVKAAKNTSGKSLVVKKKTVTLKKKKFVRIIGEKTAGKKKWFRIQFTYNKKKRKGYVRDKDLKMTINGGIGGSVVNVKTALRVRKKPGSNQPYYKVNGRQMVLAKKQYITILKARTVKKKLWYRISFDYYGKNYKGYVQAKYIKLAKTRKQKKVAVKVLSEKEFEEEMTRQGFPDSYKDSLRKLHVQYPYWQFTAYKPGIDWGTAVAAESKLGLNLISNAKSAAWKSMEEGAYDPAAGKWKVFDGSTWVAASREAICYYMDPRNFLNAQGIYQFELLEYQPQYQTVEGINQIIKNTPFAGSSFTYTDDVTGQTREITYAQAFEEAAKQSGVSPYHLASRSKQEVVTGTTTTSIAVSGTTESYPGIFNFYNIGAYSGTSPALNGLAWASRDTTYLRPWNNRYRAIVGGALYIGSGYINRGQNTGYLQKFNITSSNTYSHQYMTNVEAANSEALKMKNAYNGMLDSIPLVFSIPVYENMPAQNCEIPK